MMNLTSDPVVEGLTTTGPSYHNRTYDDERQFLIINLDSDMTVGDNYTVELYYMVQLLDDLHGLYYSDYDNEDNVTMYVLII